MATFNVASMGDRSTAAGGIPCPLGADVAVPCRIENVSSSESRILFAVYASDPNVWYGPPIEYKVTFDFKRANANYVNVTLSGKHTAFPDFEGYVDGQLVYQAESPDAGPSIWDLGSLSPWVSIPATGLGVQG